MRRSLLALLIFALAGCGKAGGRAHPTRLGVAPPPGRVIGFDPSVVGLPGSIDDTVYDSAGVVSWVKYGTSNTAWRPVPVSRFVSVDPSQSPGLKAPIGFRVTKVDGTAAWVKSGTGDTAWSIDPGGSGSTYTAGTGIGIDGGVISNTAPMGSNVNLTFVTPTIDFTATGTYSYSVPLVSGKKFIQVAGRCVYLTRNATVSVGPSFSFSQNGVDIGSAGTLPATSFNNLAAPGVINNIATTAPAVDMSTYPLAIHITAGATGTGLTDFTGYMVVVGFFN